MTNMYLFILMDILNWDVFLNLIGNILMAKNVIDII